MKRLVGACAALCLLMASGCGAVRHDLRHPGGYPGKLLDQRTFDASRSKHIQLWRATLMVAVAARIGESSVDPQDADAFARQLAEASREINFAAADAGFPVREANGLIRKTCIIDRGFESAADAGWTLDETPADDENCSGYFVNFENHMARIESRVIRAMLTSLPTDKARKFLSDVSKGDALSAMWSLTKTFRDLASAFHRGAGVYRSGTEAMAASMLQSCGHDLSYSGERIGSFNEERDTVRAAAQCLGLSQTELFDGDTVGGERFPVRLRPAAFHAMFRIARAACVRLPTISTTDSKYIEESKAMRLQSCGALAFQPQAEPLSLDVSQTKSPSPAAPPGAVDPVTILPVPASPRS